MKKVLSIILILVMSLSVVGCKTTQPSGLSGSTNACGNTFQNLNTVYCRIGLHDDWFYYNNNKGFYKTKTDGSERQQLCLEDVEHINIVGDWIYYYDNDNDYICRMKTDGSERGILEQGSTYHIYVVGETIYYYGKYDNKKGFYKMKTDSTEKECILSAEDFSISNVYIVNDDIYFFQAVNANSSETSGFYKMKTDGTNKQLIFEEGLGSPKFVDFDGEWFYYLKTSVAVDGKKGLYKFKADGTEWQAIFNLVDTEEKSEFIDDCVFKDGWVYYKLGTIINNNDNTSKCLDQVFKIKLNNTSKEELHVEEVFDYCFDDFIITCENGYEYENEKYLVYDKEYNYLFTLE